MNTQTESLVDQYYFSNRDKMISCPYQPGNLKISMKACLKRHKAAQRRKMEVFRVEDIFNYFVSQGLVRCQNCPIIETAGA
jgi:hypothetical protein